MSVEQREIPTLIEVPGPVGEAVFEDRTLQIGPEWTASDYWTAVWNRAYSGDPMEPPYPSIHVWLDVPAGEVARLAVTAVRPTGPQWRCVLNTALSVFDGVYASIGQRAGSYDAHAPRQCVELSLAEGEYPVEVWVDAGARDRVRSVAMVVGARAVVRP